MPKPTTIYQLPSTKKQPKVALVCDWLIGGGAEKVVFELHKIYPDAPIYTSYCTDEWRRKLAPAIVKAGYLQHWPFSSLRKYIPFLRAMWFSRLKLKKFDVVISASGAEAKAVNVIDGTHICYMHAPTHYYWSKYNEYLKNPGFGRFNWLARIGLKLLVGPLRRWDYTAAQLPDILIANSNYTKQQIQKFYHRESSVIHPPVDTKKFAKFSKTVDQKSGFIVIGRQTHYKKIDLAVKACTKLNLPLTVIGEGPEHEKLKELAGPNVTFLGKVEDSEKLAEKLASSAGFLFPGLDDFGIAAVEALSAGTAVVAYKDGGALDYIEEGVNGVFFEPQNSKALENALSNFNPAKYTEKDIKNSVKDFASDEFQRKIAKLVESLEL